jgi:hypothetical protein
MHLGVRIEKYLQKLDEIQKIGEKFYRDRFKCVNSF